MIASILYFLKILPVYRIRDGFSSLRGNDEIFLRQLMCLRIKTDWLSCLKEIMKGSEGSGN